MCQRCTCFNYKGALLCHCFPPSEVCPFCGKTYKRLKSHLPHCKAAASSKTPPTTHDITVNHTSPSQLATALSAPATAKRGKSTQTLSMTTSAQAKRSKNVSVVSPPTPLQSADTSSSSQSLSPSSASLPPSTKKTKQKLSEPMKTANLSSSTTVPLISTPSLPLSPTISKPKKKSLRALIEAAKSKQVSNGSPEGTRSASEDLPSGSTPFAADSLSSRTTAQTETKTNPDRDLVKDSVRPALLSSDTKPKDASKLKVSKTKKAAQSLSTTKDNSLDSNVNESSARSRVRDNFWAGNEGEIEDLSVNKMVKSGSGHQARITLQDVKAMLGRANTSRQSSRPSILSQIETTDDLSSKIRPGSSLNPVSPSLTQFSSPHLVPLAPQTLPARVETLRADEGLTMEKSQNEVRKQNTADNGSKGQYL